MKIGIAVPQGQLGPKFMRGLDRAFRHLGHETVVYNANGDKFPTGEPTDFNMIWGVFTSWIHESIQTVQYWGNDPRHSGPEIVEAVVQRQRDGDLILFADSGWKDYMEKEHCLYRGRYVPLGGDSLLPCPVPQVEVKHKVGVFGGAYPQRVAEVSYLVAKGFDLKLWGPGWETIPILRDRHMGVIEDEAELLAAIASCESVVTLRRGSYWPFSHHMALLAGRTVYDGVTGLVNGLACTDDRRTLIDVAKDILFLVTDDKEKNGGERERYQVECLEPWASIEIKFPVENNLNIFDLGSNGEIVPASMPTVLRNIANVLEAKQTEIGAIHRHEVKERETRLSKA